MSTALRVNREIGQPLSTHMRTASIAGALLDQKHELGIGTDYLNTAQRAGAVAAAHELHFVDRLSPREEAILDEVIDTMAATASSKVITVTIPDVIPADWTDLVPQKH